MYSQGRGQKDENIPDREMAETSARQKLSRDMLSSQNLIALFCFLPSWVKTFFLTLRLGKSYRGFSGQNLTFKRPLMLEG